MSSSFHSHCVMLQVIIGSSSEFDAASIQEQLGAKGYSVSKRSIDRDLKNLSVTRVLLIEKDDSSNPKAVPGRET